MDLLPFTPPFTRLRHTADLAFMVFATCLEELYWHAQIAIAFEYPMLLPFLTPAVATYSSLTQVIIALNELIAKADTHIGIACKVVSFHGSLQRNKKSSLVWEMIIDV